MTTGVAIYARVSTTNHGQDVGLQTRELRQFAEARSWTVAGEYIDAGVSGAKDSRPELNRLMADAHKRRFDVVCVWKFDRFARSVSHLLRALETFKALGIEFCSFSDPRVLSPRAIAEGPRQASAGPLSLHQFSGPDFRNAALCRDDSRYGP